MDKKVKRLKDQLEQYEYNEKISPSGYNKGIITALKFAIEVLEERK